MIYTRRFWRHASTLASRSFGQGTVLAIGADAAKPTLDLQALDYLAAGAGMAVLSLGMTMSRAVVAPRRNEPEDLREINAMVDAHLADLYTTPTYRPAHLPPGYGYQPALPTPPAAGYTYPETVVVTHTQAFDHDSHDPNQIGHPDGPAILPGAAP